MSEYESFESLWFFYDCHELWICYIGLNIFKDKNNSKKTILKNSKESLRILQVSK